jgi:heme-degrading monooxygenase HmoA
MWARVSTYRFPSDNVESVIQSFNQALDELAEQPGLERTEVLVDRSSGKALTITVWDSEETLRSSVETADRLRRDAAEAAGASIVDVSHYEVAQAEDEPPKIY